ncbi:hypothetical protein QYE76_034943 [Lolium multiflorum]|uniref:non-specific serine/threonine protein kinase n=1 Tax=Lolium multiflorum TaxID=4521 RepID=A0AAD8VNJ4_LOLMU|nr:hypothetical protein QYE76_034943 [Lolium multiflorum]
MYESEIKAIRTDNGTEFKNYTMQEFVDDEGIKHEFSAPYTPQQNGVVERKNRTIIGMARTMLSEFNSPHNFWGEAISTIVHYSNRLFLRPLHNKTPYELLTSNKPNVMYIRVFGCKCLVKNNKGKLGKFETRTIEGIFLGYAENSHAYRYYNRSTGTIEVSCDVVFLEDNGSQVEQFDPCVAGNDDDPSSAIKHMGIGHIRPMEVHNDDQDDGVDVSSTAQVEPSSTQAEPSSATQEPSSTQDESRSEEQEEDPHSTEQDHDDDQETSSTHDQAQVIPHDQALARDEFIDHEGTVRKINAATRASDMKVDQVLGSSLSVEESSDILHSPNGAFTCGFKNISHNAFVFSIWFTNTAEKTVVWSANQLHPVHSWGSEVLLDMDGRMVVKDYNGQLVWENDVYSSSNAEQAQLLDTGNFIVKGQGDIILWQSFDSPTDTLLPNQNITSAIKLVSANRYTYKELQRATGKFKDMIGRGASGLVYKGVLKDNRAVAVKRLADINQGEEEFQHELSVIARIYHMNLVRVWGFCSDGPHRILVLEYVENGSLDKNLFSSKGSHILLRWNERFKIALGVAKGLAYLHHECLEWVIHCDLKPENILLDEKMEPKITDFGLAKLLNRGGSDKTVSRIHGTRGYIAPEWVSSAQITAKVDVYSFGVVLLELLKGARVSDWASDADEEVEMVLRRVIKMLAESLMLEGGEQLWIADFIDSRLDSQFDNVQARTMIKLAVSCIEEDSRKRPTMENAVQMLLSVDEAVWHN